MKTVIDPSMLFISDDEWFNQEKRDAFLERLYCLLKTINENENIKIFWDDMLESHLWELPQLRPWRQERGFRNLMLNSIPRLFQENVERIEYHNEWEPCSVNPSLRYPHNNGIVFQCFLKLMHEMIDRAEDVFFCVGNENQEDQYIFDCSCHDNVINPKIIKSEDDFLLYINIETELWPKCKDEVDKFERSVLLTKEKFFRDKDFKYNFAFSDNFMKDIVMARRHRSSILKQLTKKLVLSYQEAAASDLHDEPIEGGEEYRIRVTQRPTSTRIQYIFNRQDNQILFTSYSPEGHHDDALR